MSEHATTLFTLDQGDMRAFICSGPHEGDFTIIHCGTIGEGFIAQSTDNMGESIHAHARDALSATYG